MKTFLPKKILDTNVKRTLLKQILDWRKNSCSSRAWMDERMLLNEAFIRL